MLQYLESSDPAILNASHLTTAHYLVTSFITTLFQQKQQQQSPSNYLPPSIQSALPPVTLNNSAVPSSHLSMFQPFSKASKKGISGEINFHQTKLEDYDMLEILGINSFERTLCFRNRNIWQGATM
jgi:hypothetical protein